MKTMLNVVLASALTFFIVGCGDSSDDKEQAASISLSELNATVENNAGYMVTVTLDYLDSEITDINETVDFYFCKGGFFDYFAYTSSTPDEEIIRDEPDVDYGFIALSGNTLSFTSVGNGEDFNLTSQSGTFAVGSTYTTEAANSFYNTDVTIESFSDYNCSRVFDDEEER